MALREFANHLVALQNQLAALDLNIVSTASILNQAAQYSALDNVHAALYLLTRVLQRLRMSERENCDAHD